MNTHMLRAGLWQTVPQYHQPTGRSITWEFERWIGSEYRDDGWHVTAWDDQGLRVVELGDMEVYRTKRDAVRAAEIAMKHLHRSREYGWYVIPE